MDCGAWPFLVGGLICLVNSDNERDSVLLTSHRLLRSVGGLILVIATGCQAAEASAVRDLLRRTGGF